MNESNRWALGSAVERLIKRGCFDSASAVIGTYTAMFLVCADKIGKCKYSPDEEHFQIGLAEDLDSYLRWSVDVLAALPPDRKALPVRVAIEHATVAAHEFRLILEADALMKQIYSLQAARTDLCSPVEMA
jgi:hypothetical protein